MESKMTYSDHVKPYQIMNHCTGIMRCCEIPYMFLKLSMVVA